MIGKNRTEYICFDSRECKACWKCLDVCLKDVFWKAYITDTQVYKDYEPR